MNTQKEYIVICQSAWCNERGTGIYYSWDGERFSTRQLAILHGFETRDSDDFNIGVVQGKILFSFDWMDEPGMDNEGTLTQIAESIGMVLSSSVKL
ncbi:MAG: hypothetical protein ACRYG5_10020 [Janthinobacterium lividum]